MSYFHLFTHASVVSLLMQTAVKTLELGGYNASLRSAARLWIVSMNLDDLILIRGTGRRLDRLFSSILTKDASSTCAVRRGGQEHRVCADGKKAISENECRRNESLMHGIGTSLRGEVFDKWVGLLAEATEEYPDPAICQESSRDQQVKIVHT